MENDLRVLVDALERSNRRIEDLENRLRQIEENRDYRNLSYIHGVLKRFVNINNIRAMFYTESLRTAGLIDQQALAKVEEAAKARYVAKPGYGIEEEGAGYHLASVKSEFDGDYKTADDFNPAYASKDHN